jgi:two-component sensor histidine kinase
LKEIAAFVGIAVRMLNDQAGLKQELAEQTILTNEMKHRVRNVFALTDGLIRMSAKRAADKDELAEVLSGRLHSLSRAHALVAKTDNTDLAILLREVTAPHRTVQDEPRVHVQGPRVVCGDHATTGLALIFHELTTNSAKYGALSWDGGHVDVSWQGDERALRITWTEFGGPPPGPPSEPSGLGSVLIRNTVRGQFRGKADYDWRPEGLHLTLDLILDEATGRELPH